MSFKFPSLVKLPNHKTFNYKPRYYDEDKETAQALIERRQKYLNGSDSEKGELAKESIRSLYQTKRARKQRQSNTASNLRLVVILMALLIISYFIFIY